MLALATKETFDLEAVQDACNAAAQAARTAAKISYSQVGERDACGFAWVNVWGVRSNSKLGRALQAAGFSKDYTGGLQLWNPSGHHTQSITVKEAGAYAYAQVLKDKLGLEKVYAGSRMD
jgi:hypothetical protein